MVTRSHVGFRLDLLACTTGEGKSVREGQQGNIGKQWACDHEASESWTVSQNPVKVLTAGSETSW